MDLALLQYGLTYLRRSPSPLPDYNIPSFYDIFPAISRCGHRQIWGEDHFLDIVFFVPSTLPGARLIAITARRQLGIIEYIKKYKNKTKNIYCIKVQYPLSGDFLYSNPSDPHGIINDSYFLLIAEI